MGISHYKANRGVLRGDDCCVNSRLNVMEPATQGRHNTGGGLRLHKESNIYGAAGPEEKYRAPNQGDPGTELFGFLLFHREGWILLQEGRLNG